MLRALMWMGLVFVFTAGHATAADQFIQFTIPADADVVAEGPDGSPPSVTHGIDTGGSSFLSQSEAWARDYWPDYNRGIGYGDGLPDDGRIGLIQLLPYNQMNVARREGADYRPIPIDAPNRRYTRLTFYATLGSNTGYTLSGERVQVTLHYTSGPDGLESIEVHDWFRDYAGEEYLIDGLDRTIYTGSELDRGWQDANRAAIFALPVYPDSARILDTISLTKTTGTGVVNLFAASGMAIPEPGSLLMLSGVMLCLAVRRRREGSTSHARDAR